MWKNNSTSQDYQIREGSWSTLSIYPPFSYISPCFLSANILTNLGSSQSVLYRPLQGQN